MSKYVLDASAVLAVLQDEKGRERVESLLSQSTISAVNMAEVISKLTEKGMTFEDAELCFNYLNIPVIDYDYELGVLTGKLRNETKKFGLSLGDRCCVALGIITMSTIVTADKSWKALQIKAEIELIR